MSLLSQSSCVLVLSVIMCSRSLSHHVFCSLSNQAEGDVKEEILQPPEPRPVPPILTPSPPSAFPTVTNARQDNDRYHPKPILHVLASDQNPDLNENYNKPGQDGPERRLERKLSIEIKKVPLQEGPRSFEGNSALHRSHAFKRSSSMCEESAEPPRPNHLPLREETGQSEPSPDRSPGRTALSFTNPLHTDFPDALSSVSSTASVEQQSDHTPRRVTPMSIAGQSLPTHTSSTYTHSPLLRLLPFPALPSFESLDSHLIRNDWHM